MLWMRLSVCKSGVLL